MSGCVKMQPNHSVSGQTQARTGAALAPIPPVNTGHPGLGERRRGAPSCTEPPYRLDNLLHAMSCAENTSTLHYRQGGFETSSSPADDDGSKLKIRIV
jgi:hypothetical protein